MNHRERFASVFAYQPVDRLPVHFFGTWRETKERWAREGLADAGSYGGGSAGPQLAEMDPLWEGSLWDNQGLAKPWPLGDGPASVLEETDDHRIVRSPLGGVSKHGKRGSTIPQDLEHDLKPTRADWERFKRFLDPHDPRRRPDDWKDKARALNQREHVTCFLAGSLFGRTREWMGVEAISYLAYDDPALYEEIIDYHAEFHMALTGPILDEVHFDFGYFFEDCCFNTGPLLSPELYRTYYDKYYRRMIEFYRSKGVPLLLLDSDGRVDALLPQWLDTGFDIIFPIEVGTWGSSPVEFRRRFGRRCRMMGGVNKLTIPKGERAIRAELDALRPVVEEGGYLPIPDHRIPPDCSLEQFRTYVRVFKETFWPPEALAGETT